MFSFLFCFTCLDGVFCFCQVETFGIRFFPMFADKTLKFSNGKKPWLVRLLWLLYRGLYILPTYIGIIRSHCKDPY